MFIARENDVAFLHIYIRSTVNMLENDVVREDFVKMNVSFFHNFPKNKFISMHKNHKHIPKQMKKNLDFLIQQNNSQHSSKNNNFNKNVNRLKLIFLGSTQSAQNYYMPSLSDVWLKILNLTIEQKKNSSI